MATYLEATRPAARALWLHVNGVTPCYRCWVRQECHEARNLRADLEQAVDRWLREPIGSQLPGAVTTAILSDPEAVARGAEDYVLSDGPRTDRRGRGQS